MATTTASPPTGVPHDDRPLLHAMAKYWWVFLIRGIAAIIFSVMALIWPALTLLTLTLFWGVYALVDGVLALWAGFTGRGADGNARWWLIVVGLLGLAAGVIAIAAPVWTAGLLLITIAVWAIVIGVFEVIGAIRLRKEIDNEWMLGLSGVLAILFGVLFFMQPLAGALAVVWMISLFAFLFGVTTIALAFNLRKHRT
jgi:uncharacterized membrane protein HdeD (DUF308 family)